MASIQYGNIVFRGTISRLPVVYKGIINMYYVRVYICIYVCIGLSVHLRSLINLRDIVKLY